MYTPLRIPQTQYIPPQWNVRNIPRNTGKTWTENDDRKLKALVNSRQTIDFMAKELERTPNSIVFRVFGAARIDKRNGLDIEKYLLVLGCTEQQFATFNVHVGTAPQYHTPGIQRGEWMRNCFPIKNKHEDINIDTFNKKLDAIIERLDAIENHINSKHSYEQPVVPISELELYDTE